jgi:hypothetical protein
MNIEQEVIPGIEPADRRRPRAPATRKQTASAPPVYNSSHSSPSTQRRAACR